MKDSAQITAIAHQKYGVFQHQCGWLIPCFFKILADILYFGFQIPLRFIYSILTGASGIGHVLLMNLQAFQDFVELVIGPAQIKASREGTVPVFS